MEEKITLKTFTMNILNGIALGTVLCLVPGALLGELLKYIAKIYPSLAFLSMAVTISNAMIGLASGVIIGMLFKFTPIQSLSIGLATLYASGSIVPTADKTGFILKGAGDIVTMIFTAALATAFILLIGNKTKSYAILILPPLTLVIVGGIGRYLLPTFSAVTKLLGDGIKHLLTLQPILLTILIAIIFACLIVTPITSVGVALAINIDGIASGAANLGICACGFTLAIAGWHINSKGISLAHFIGSPKISMANVFAKPKIMLPVICSAACTGVLASIFGIKGTAMSAGFGFSGLVGPLAHLSTTNGGIFEIIKTFIIFAIVPIVTGYIFVKLFTKIIPIIKPDDYKIEI
ncbi:PTS transporter subunit IIC [Gemella cuniculi]|uniref:PTS transporter subunit IIC n=1 Tax=Gemella cuniculi TaxID=150240 RepID=UPI00041BDE8C|nr:PTS sugar transporter subunit IIC [Gemella cuniculi]